ncbi:MAG: cytochrome o ubiquinol oxidase subunit I, partial [bacterium]|nr:cytochrome o ubiquinol oxidase subunit I [bacterium]
AEWQPYLIVAALGALVILLGVACLVVQLIVSVMERQKRRDHTGDPWNGRTLEWLTSSPPAVYNFAVLPEVRDRDAFLDMKQRGVAYRRPDRYYDIHLPKNSGVGPILGGLAFVLGFAVVWHIWWLVAVCAVAMWVAIIIRASNDDTEYCLSAGEVEKIETERYEELARALPKEAEGAPDASTPLQENPT